MKACLTCALRLVLLLAPAAQGAFLSGGARDCSGAAACRRRSTAPAAQFGFKIQKSERLLIREAWERADAYRPGKPNWFTSQKKDLVELHHQLQPEILSMPSEPHPTNETSLLGSLLRVLTTGDLALTLCSKEAPVLTQLRDWLVAELPMPEAVLGLPEEQGRVLSTLAAALDARKLLDLGTFTGYSSIAMALAAADDAKVICCEPDTTAARSARDWWIKAGVAAKMEMHETKAEALLDRLIADGSGPSFDMVFVDVGDRAAYAGLHEQLMKLVRVGGVIVYYDTLWAADHVLSHEPFPTMRAFNARLAADPRVLASLVPLSYGITLCVKTLEVEQQPLAAALEARSAGDSAPFLALLAERRAELERRLASLAPPQQGSSSAASAAAPPATDHAAAEAAEAGEEGVAAAAEPAAATEATPPSTEPASPAAAAAASPAAASPESELESGQAPPSPAQPPKKGSWFF